MTKKENEKIDFEEKSNISTVLFLIALIVGIFMYNFYNPIDYSSNLNNTYGDDKVSFNNNYFNNNSSGIISLKTKEEFYNFILNQSDIYTVQNNKFGSNYLTRGINNVGVEKNIAYDKEETVDYSGTNNQEIYVDEADIGKIDGKYLYSINGGRLYVSKIYPGRTMEVLSNISLYNNKENDGKNNKNNYNSNIRVKSILVGDNKLVLFSNSYIKKDYISDYSYTMEVRNLPVTDVRVYDISDKLNLKEINNFLVSGNFYDARLINNSVYFISKKYQNYYVLYNQVYKSKTLQNRQINYDNLDVPEIYMNGKSYMIETNLLKSFDDGFNLGSNNNNFNYNNIISFNLNNISKNLGYKVLSSKSYVGENIDNVYVSKNNIYFIANNYFNVDRFKLFKLISKDVFEKNIYLKINQFNDSENLMIYLKKYYASLDDKKREILFSKINKKSSDLYDKLSDENQKSLIYKISIKNSSINFSSFGVVDGRLLNRYSLSEDNGGDLRVATTKNLWLGDGKRKISNNVFVLDNRLKIIGKLENIAKGENIYSTRFEGDKLFMVTFKQIDPLFVIDLKNKKEPKVLGELKVDGVSLYLDLLDNNTLFGVGYNTKIDGTRVIRDGIKLSLFNISDYNNPRELDSYVIKGDFSNSLLFRDTHAFMYSKTRKILAVPIDLTYKLERNGGDYNKYNYYNYVNKNSLFVFNTSNFELKLIGNISHQNIDSKNNAYKDYYSNKILRSFYINNILYSMSNNHVYANNLSDDLGFLDKLIFFSKDNGSDLSIASPRIVY